MRVAIGVCLFVIDTRESCLCLVTDASEVAIKGPFWIPLIQIFNVDVLTHCILKDDPSYFTLN